MPMVTAGIEVYFVREYVKEGEDTKAVRTVNERMIKVGSDREMGVEMEEELQVIRQKLSVVRFLIQDSALKDLVAVDELWRRL